MKKDVRKNLGIAFGILGAFVLWTVAVCIFDVQAVGPQESAVGFATLNQAIHDTVGVHMWLYFVTDWLSLIPVGMMLCFALLGLVQWIRRKHIGKVDRNLLLLGLFYIVVLAMYLLFEGVAINHRPILINGILEASYPSSTTMLVLCMCPTAIMQFRFYMTNRFLKRCLTVSVMIFVVLMVVGRFLSGVHWVTDIVGGMLISAGLVKLYAVSIHP